MSKFDGTKVHCERRNSAVGTCPPTCSADSLPCLPTSVCRHRPDDMSERTNCELAEAMADETDLESLRKICDETSRRLVELSDPNTKTVNDGRRELSPMDMASENRSLESELGMLKAKIRELSDMTEFDRLAEEGAEVARESSDAESDAAELAHERDKRNIEGGLLVTEADFNRISAALAESHTLDEWVSRIRQITGNGGVSDGMRIVRCSPTERTISELFKLKEKAP